MLIATCVSSALGCISYVVVMLCRKRGALVNPWMYALSAMFALMLVLGAIA